MEITGFKKRQFTGDGYWIKRWEFNQILQWVRVRCFNYGWGWWIWILQEQLLCSETVKIILVLRTGCEGLAMHLFFQKSICISCNIWINKKKYIKLIQLRNAFNFSIAMAFLVAFQLQLFPSFRKFFLYQFVLDLIIAWVTLVKITLKSYKKNPS